MSQVRLYLDEDAMRRSIVFGLRARNVDVLTASEAEMINRNDQEHLAAATASGRVLYTFNVADYCVLHQTWISQDRPHAESSLRRSNVTQLVKNSGGSCGLSDGFPRKPCGTVSNSYPRGSDNCRPRNARPKPVHSITSSRSFGSTCSPFCTSRRTTLPATGAAMVVCIFIASITSSLSPFSTL